MGRAVNEIIIEVQVEALEEGGFLATSQDLQGLIAQGRTIAETLEIAQDVARKLVDSYLEHGDPLPAKLQAALKASKRKIVTRIPIDVSVEPARV
jgi:predicted RNase H-like HicB family nuclease